MQAKELREESLKVSSMMSLYEEYVFQERDVVNLAVALADVAHKWNEIAIMLGLPEVTRTECGEGSNSAMKLYNVLCKLIVVGHSTAAPATMKTLKKAIESPLVERPDIASKLEDRLKTKVSSLTPAVTTFKESVLSKYKNKICLHYSKLAQVPRGVWPPVVSNTFINLALVKTSGEPSKSDYSVRGNADIVLEKKEKIKYEQAFGTHRDSEIILVLGRPGSGKTTLVHKVIKDWVQGLVLKGAELVYLISLRSLTSEHNKLPNILSPFHFQENTLQEVSDHIEKVDGKGVCFILDGFDKYPSKNYEKSLISALINESYLPEAMVVVTSRPAAASDRLPNKSSFKQIEVFGFSRKDVFEYIDCFPFSKSSITTEPFPENLKTFLMSHPGVLDLCYLPVNVAIVCFLYDFNPGLLPETQTEMYKHFTKSIIIRQLKQYKKSFKIKSLEDLGEEKSEHFKNLCKLAFEMTARSCQVMSHGEFTADSQLSLGLVTTDISPQLSGEYQNSYSFLHLTLQEFLAAYHISTASLEKQKELIKQYCDTVHMRNVWKFYFGLAKFENDLLAIILTKTFFKKLLYTDKLFCIQCAYEAKKKCISELVSSSWIRIRNTVSTYDISAIAYVMSEAASIHNKATPTTHLEMVDRMVDSNKLAAVKNLTDDKAESHLVDLTIIDNLLDSASVKLLVEELSAGFKPLEILNLSTNDTGDDGALISAEGLKFNCSLQELDLSSNNITTTGVTEIMHYACPLRRIDFSCNDIGDDGAKQVADKLKHKSLKELNLSRYDIGIDGAEALADAITSDVMVELDLSCTDFGLSINKLPMPLKFEPSTIEHSDSRGRLRLSLKYNMRIGRECSDGIAFLSRFKKLRELNLSDDMINTQGAKVLTDCLLYSNNCHTFEDLNLSGNSSISACVTDTAVKLLQHDNIKCINLEYPRSLFFGPQCVVDLSNRRISGDDVLSFAKEIQLMQDFNYSQNYFSRIDIRVTHIPMDTQTVMAVLRELKNCNRVKRVEICHTGVTCNEDTTQLRKAFEHHKMQRSITLIDEQSHARTMVQVPAVQ